MLAGAGLAMAPAARAALPVPTGNTLSFRLIRRGSDIGRHTLTFDQRGDDLTVHAEVEAIVTVMSIPVVHYTHRTVEVWQGGRLASLNSDTNKNGNRQWVRASRSGEGLMVKGSQAEAYLAPEQAIATSYWNKRMLDGPMISTEDGVLLRPRIAPPTSEAIPTAAGGRIDATRYSLTGAFDVDVWYDATDTWASLAFNVADGSSVRYERI